MFPWEHKLALQSRIGDLVDRHQTPFPSPGRRTVLAHQAGTGSQFLKALPFASEEPLVFPWEHLAWRRPIVIFSPKS
jgi:hypothetical protein